MNKRNVCVQGGNINGNKQEIGGEEGAEDGKEIIQIFDVRK